MVLSAEKPKMTKKEIPKQPKRLNSSTAAVAAAPTTTKKSVKKEPKEKLSNSLINKSSEDFNDSSDFVIPQNKRKTIKNEKTPTEHSNARSKEPKKRTYQRRPSCSFSEEPAPAVRTSTRRRTRSSEQKFPEAEMNGEPVKDDSDLSKSSSALPSVSGSAVRETPATKSVRCSSQESKKPTSPHTSKVNRVKVEPPEKDERLKRSSAKKSAKSELVKSSTESVGATKLKNVTVGGKDKPPKAKQTYKSRKRSSESSDVLKHSDNSNGKKKSSDRNSANSSKEQSSRKRTAKSSREDGVPSKCTPKKKNEQEKDVSVKNDTSPLLPMAKKSSPNSQLLTDKKEINNTSSAHFTVQSSTVKCPTCKELIPEELLGRHILMCLKKKYQARAKSHLPGFSDREQLYEDEVLARQIHEDMNRETVSSKKESAGTEDINCCQLCAKDLTHMNTFWKMKHINNCFDDDEAKNARKKNKVATAARQQIPPCPMCGKQFKTVAMRRCHLKKCAHELSVSPEKALKLIAEQEKKFKESQPAATVTAGPSSASSLSLRNKLNKFPDEQMQMAMAMSSSLFDEQEKLNEKLTDTVRNIHQGVNRELRKMKRSQKKGPVSTPLLLTLSKEDRLMRYAQRVDSIISERPHAHFSSQFPRSSLSLRCGDVYHLPEDADNPSLPTSLWSKSSLMGTSLATESFYVHSLMPPIQVDTVIAGSRLKPLSAIPGRGLDKDETVSAPPPDQFPGDSPVPSTQTAVLLAELAQLNEEDLDDDAGSDSTIKQTQGFYLSEETVSTTEKQKKLAVAALLEDFCRLINDPQLSDIELIAADGFRVFAHRLLLSVRCPQILNLVVSRENRWVIEMKDLSKNSLLAFLRYLYAGQLDFEKNVTADLLQLSRKFDLPQLASICEKTLQTLIGEACYSSSVESVASDVPESLEIDEIQPLQNEDDDKRDGADCGHSGELLSIINDQPSEEFLPLFVASPLKNSQNNALHISPKSSYQESPTHKESSGLESPTHKESSGLEFPIPKESSDVEFPIPKESSDVEFPIPKESSDVEFPTPKESSDVEFPTPKESSDVEFPTPKESSDVEFPTPKESSDVESPTHKESSDVESPTHKESSDVESPTHKESSDVESPTHKESSDVESPTHKESSDVESPTHMESSDVESPTHMESSDVESPTHMESSDVEFSSKRQNKRKVEIDGSIFVIEKSCKFINQMSPSRTDACTFRNVNYIIYESTSLESTLEGGDEGSLDTNAEQIASSLTRPVSVFSEELQYKELIPLVPSEAESEKIPTFMDLLSGKCLSERSNKDKDSNFSPGLPCLSLDPGFTDIPSGTVSQEDGRNSSKSVLVPIDQKEKAKKLSKESSESPTLASDFGFDDSNELFSEPEDAEEELVKINDSGDNGIKLETKSELIEESLEVSSDSFFFYENQQNLPGTGMSSTALYLADAVCDNSTDEELLSRSEACKALSPANQSQIPNCTLFNGNTTGFHMADTILEPSKVIKDSANSRCATSRSPLSETRLQESVSKSSKIPPKNLHKFSSRSLSGRFDGGDQNSRTDFDTDLEVKELSPDLSKSPKFSFSPLSSSQSDSSVKNMVDSLEDSFKALANSRRGRKRKSCNMELAPSSKRSRRKRLNVNDTVCEAAGDCSKGKFVRSPFGKETSLELSFGNAKSSVAVDNMSDLVSKGLPSESMTIPSDLMESPEYLLNTSQTVNTEERLGISDDDGDHYHTHYDVELSLPDSPGSVLGRNLDTFSLLSEDSNIEDTNDQFTRTVIFSQHDSNSELVSNSKKDKSPDAKLEKTPCFLPGSSSANTPNRPKKKFTFKRKQLKNLTAVCPSVSTIAPTAFHSPVKRDLSTAKYTSHLKRLSEDHAQLSDRVESDCEYQPDVWDDFEDNGYVEDFAVLSSSSSFPARQTTSPTEFMSAKKLDCKNSSKSVSPRTPEVNDKTADNESFNASFIYDFICSSSPVMSQTESSPCLSRDLQPSSCVSLPLADRQLDLEKSKTPLALMRRGRKKELTVPSPFTPIPTYASMTTPELKKEMKKHGCRQMTRKKMVTLLQAIYQRTHQYETDSEMEQSMVQVDVPLEAQAYDPHNVCLQTRSKTQDCFLRSHNEKSSPFVLKGPKKGKNPPKMGNIISTIAISPESESTNFDDDDLVSDTEDAVGAYEESFMANEEDIPCSQPQTSSDNLHDRLRAFVQRNPEIYTKMLFYEPVDFDQLKKKISESKITCSAAKLLGFLDNQCITFAMNKEKQHHGTFKPRGARK